MLLLVLLSFGEVNVAQCGTVKRYMTPRAHAVECPETVGNFIFNVSLCTASGVKMDKTVKNEFQCLSF